MARYRVDSLGRISLLLWFGLFLGLVAFTAKAETGGADFEDVFGDSSLLLGALQTEPEGTFLELAKVAMTKGAWGDAQVYAHRVLTLNPQNLEAEAISATTASISGALDEAHQALNALKDARSDHPYISLIEAILLEKQGKLESARKTLTRALKENGEHPVFRYFSGELFLAAKDSAKAETEFKRILNREPGFTPALAGMGEVSLLRKEWRTAARFYSRALQHDPENRLYHKRLVDIYRQDGETAKARQTLQQMNFHSPRVKEALLAKGRQLLHRGDFLQTVAEMDRFFTIYRKSSEACYLRAAALTNLRRYKEARRDLGAFLLASWGLPQVHHRAGVCFLVMEDVDGAAEQFRDAVAKDPALSESFLFLLVVEQMRGNFEEALEGLALARAAGVFPPLVQYLMAQTYLALGEWSKYGEKMSQALGLIPGFLGDVIFPPPRNELWRSVARDRSLMVLYYRNGWYGKALEAAERLTEACPQDIFVRYFAALAQEMQNRPMEAKESFLKLVRIYPSLAEGYLGLGRVSLQTGVLDEAEAALGKALSLYPDNASGHMYLGDLQVRRGELQAAIASYRRAISLAPLTAEAYPRLSRLLAESSETLLEAADLAWKGLEQTPSGPLALDAAGWIMLLEGDTDGGLEKIAAAQVGRPDDPVILYHKGYALFLQGSFADARRSLGQAFALSDNFPGADRARELLVKIPSQD